MGFLVNSKTRHTVSQSVSFHGPAPRSPLHRLDSVPRNSENVQKQEVQHTAQMDVKFLAFWVLVVSSVIRIAAGIKYYVLCRKLTFT